MARVLTAEQLIERSIIKTYRKELWAPFLSAVNRYALIAPGDHIAVCISGGKDSFLMAKLFQQLSRCSDIPFQCTYLLMDPGYDPKDRKAAEDNAAMLGIPLTVFQTNVFAIAERQADKPCYLCARMRRGHLYNKARELSCNKIALGHHLNDAIETTLMAMFYSSKLETIIPKSESENFAGMELIRPMYAIKEHDIERWCAHNNLRFIQCACHFIAASANDDMSSARRKVKGLIADLKKDNPVIEDNIFRSLHQVQIESFPGYKAAGKRHSFLENYPHRKYGHDSDDEN